MNADDAINKLKLKFSSGNSVDVDRAVITKEEWEAIKNLIDDIENNQS